MAIITTFSGGRCIKAVVIIASWLLGHQEERHYHPNLMVTQNKKRNLPLKDRFIGSIADAFQLSGIFEVSKNWTIIEVYVQPRWSWSSRGFLVVSFGRTNIYTKVLTITQRENEIFSRFGWVAASAKWWSKSRYFYPVYQLYGTFYLSDFREDASLILRRELFTQQKPGSEQLHALILNH